MSFLLPDGAPFGCLEIDDVWIRVDDPILFVALNQSGSRFLFNAIDENPNQIRYVAVPISVGRITQIKTGGFPLRVAFEEPEDREAFVVTADYAQGSVASVSVNPKSLTASELPVPDVRLEVPVPTKTGFDSGDLRRRAVSERRTLLALRLDPPQLLRTEYPVRELGESLLTLQALTEALVQEEEPDVTRRGPLPRHIVEDAELAVVELQAASFVAVMASSPPQSVDSPSLPLGLEYPRTSAALNHLVRLVSAASDESSLASELSHLGRRSVAKTKELLSVAVEQHTSLGLYLAEPSGRAAEATVDERSAGRALLILSEVEEDRHEIVLRDATLVGINLRTGVFELHSQTHDPAKFSGKMTEAARSQVEGMPTGDDYRYVARIESTTAFSDLTDETKTKYRLQSIQPSDGG